ncbi:13492_t:CDS:2 [Funneliformis geosporum]|uniref:13492_t:CDS:1 n=1 Tax=Funneliformis geosporum TaxID=1117311 RepID=A0A9W4SVD5_9GLOM|nr:13492_t:CDS:2 [Funneliformis geosporum]
MSGSPIRFNKSLQYDLKTPVNYIREKPPELTNLHESPKSTNSDEPLKLIDLDKPPKSTNSNEPPKSTNSDESPKSINSDESPKSTNSDKPPKSTNSDKPSKSINSDEPPKSTNSDEQYELPETDIYIQYLPNRIKELEVVVEIKSKLCPKCLTIDNLEKEGYYISLTFDEASKKRKKKDDSCKFTSDTKDQTIIHELSICPASEVSIDIPPEDSNMRKVLNQFHKLYYEIDNAEKNGN